MASRPRPAVTHAAFLTMRQAAARLGVTVNAVRAWTRAAHLSGAGTLVGLR